MEAATLQEEMLFDAARQLASPAACKEFLDRACAGDAALHARVMALLASQADADRFFTQSASAMRPFLDAATLAANQDPASGSRFNLNAEERPGTRIGRYKLLEKIGEGGCGVVYMAEQEVPVRRRVALKVIKLGMDTKSVIARFEAERQALAMMDHPNIARVLDAGATDAGRPYFVMELVRGFKITEYCDQNKLGTPQRLGLFIQVCHAIQHAHQKGVIHRDIKPSNILVTLHDGQPVPKVIDFGIAKATEARLTDKTLFTAYAQIIGTPAYMSPEQAEMSGLDVDTRCDIYSLGVLLYELLTGKTPFDSKELLQLGVDEMRRTLRETEPHRPSKKLNTLALDELTVTAKHRHAEPPKLLSQLQGDLDWIVMKALEKDRTHRYETANGLAMDIQRHLNNEPVVARPPSRRYRFQKLVRRNKGVFAGVGAVGAVLIIGLSTSTWLFFRERDARQRAVAAEQKEARLRQDTETRLKITQTVIDVNREQFKEADSLAANIHPTEATVEGAAAFRSLGEYHALENFQPPDGQHGLQNQWQLATERFNTLLQINQYDPLDLQTLDYLEQGCALVEHGDLNGYEQFCQAAVAAFVNNTNPVVAERILKICLLRPAGRRDIASLVPLAEVAANTFSATDNPGMELFQFHAAWACVSLALMEYRQGNYAHSVEWSKRCLATRDSNQARTATARVLLAMAYRQLHQTDQAQSELAQGRADIETTFNRGLDRGSRENGFWFDWVFARILLREATAAVEEKSHATSLN